MSDQKVAVEVGGGWNNYDACAAVEGFDGIEHTAEELLAAWQHLLDTGLVWQLQGFYGRTATELIRTGRIFVGGKPALVQEPDLTLRVVEVNQDGVSWQDFDNLADALGHREEREQIYISKRYQSLGKHHHAFGRYLRNKPLSVQFFLVYAKDGKDVES